MQQACKDFLSSLNWKKVAFSLAGALLFRWSLKKLFALAGPKKDAKNLPANVEVIVIDNKKNSNSFFSLFSSQEEHIGGETCERICDRIQTCVSSLQEGKPPGQRKEEIHFLIDTPGGCAISTATIVSALKLYREKGGLVKVYVPRRAISAGTILSLAADEIITTSTARFSHVDMLISLPIVGSFPVLDFIEAEEKHPSALMFVVSLCCKRAVATHKKLISDICGGDEEKYKLVWDSLVNHEFLHGIPLGPEDLKKIGFNVKTDPALIPQSYLDMLQ